MQRMREPLSPSFVGHGNLLVSPPTGSLALALAL
jgi:hypothetical protein